MGKLLAWESDQSISTQAAAASPKPSHRLDHLHQHGLGVAVHHVAVVAVEQRVHDPGIALALAALDDIDLLGLVGVEDRHAEDRRGFVGARRRIHHVIGADDERDVGVGEIVVDVLELEDEVVGHAGLGQQDVHLAGHASSHRMDRELDLDARRLQQLHEFVELLLSLRDGETVARHDDDRAGVAHEDAGVAGLDRLQAALDGALLVLGDGAEVREQNVADRAIHRLRHEQRQQHAGGADHHAGDHQRRVLQHEPLQGRPRGR